MHTSLGRDSDAVVGHLQCGHAAYWRARRLCAYGHRHNCGLVQCSPLSFCAAACDLCLHKTRLCVCVSPKQSLADGRRASSSRVMPGRPRRGRWHRGAPHPVAHGHRQLRALRGRVRVRVPGARGRRPGAAGDRRGVAARAPRPQGHTRGALPVGGAGAVAPRRRRRGRAAGARGRPGHERRRQRAAAQAAARRTHRLRGRRPRAHASRAAVRPPPSSGARQRSGRDAGSSGITMRIGNLSPPTCNVARRAPTAARVPWPDWRAR